MSSGICSHGLVLATAMVVSSTVIFLTFSRQKNLSLPKQTLRSCLSSGTGWWGSFIIFFFLNYDYFLLIVGGIFYFFLEGKKRDKKKKKVQFAENVKETSGNGEEYRKEHNKKLIATTEGRSGKVDGFCRNKIPANRIALYNGILRDRVHKMECSY